MADVLFYIFAAITLIAALVMVLNPNAVNGAMAMIVSFVGTAALFVLLEAYFLAAIQVLVYAGAVMVLFLFIIMLIDTDRVDAVLKGKLGSLAAVVGSSLAVVLLGSLLYSMDALPRLETVETVALPSGEEGYFPFTTAAKSFGYILFTKYMLPFQVAGFLLFVAMIGVIVVSKKSYEEKVAEAAAKNPAPESSLS